MQSDDACENCYVIIVLRQHTESKEKQFAVADMTIPCRRCSDIKGEEVWLPLLQQGVLPRNSFKILLHHAYLLQQKSTASFLPFVKKRSVSLFTCSSLTTPIVQGCNESENRIMNMQLAAANPYGDHYGLPSTAVPCLWNFGGT